MLKIVDDVKYDLFRRILPAIVAEGNAPMMEEAIDAWASTEVAVLFLKEHGVIKEVPRNED